MPADRIAPAPGPALHVAAEASLAALATLQPSSFFHTAAWHDAVQRAWPRYRPFALVARDAAGVVQGACAFAAVRRLRLLRLYAGPLGTYGGVLARHAAAAVALAQAMVALGGERKLALVRVHDFDGSTARLVQDTPRWRSWRETCQVLDLPEDPQTLFQQAFTSQNRNKIRKAEKAGVQVRCGRDAAALHIYASLYRSALPRFGVRHPLPDSLFSALAGMDGVQVWIAEREGLAIAALLNLSGGGQIMNWGNVSRPDAWADAPNNLLHWRALEAGCRDAQGPRLYNFGGSAGLPGVHAFKASFGAREHEVLRLEFRAPWLDWASRRFPLLGRVGS